ncbi:winged helix-turn-helix transcriptional regulator [Chitinophaga sp. LS1]|uniref:winged helix-turn-helix transcriptional regulator n=1 Tax=Chitinophaga sp. LS1 TaxID=3051176 RepID=UPI002AAADF1F|nr:winged helix-turn-helix transcriptional regulator [Chitinophaga sp. LS1]WPV67944.1 winged helix-turn-helix transcriptional regulator [Chitinophaga sp. LS1]
MKGCPIQTMLSSNKDCNQQLGVAHDILDVLNGKWKMEVILQLLQHEKRRFKDLQTAIPGGVSAKVFMYFWPGSVVKEMKVEFVGSDVDSAY